MKDPPVARSEEQASKAYAEGQSGRSTRLIAALLLIPSVPLLLLSAGALVLFYVAPVRFGQLFARLPGDQILRSALAFAPAALLALVILATLYLLEGPPSAEAVAPRAAGVQAPPSRRPRLDPARLPRAALGIALPLLALSTLAALLAFAMPDRFWDLFGGLPGQRYLRAAVPLAPASLGALTLLAAALAWRGKKDAGRSWTAGVARVLPAIALALSLLMLAASIGALALFTAQPARLRSLIERVPTETLLRLELALAPIVLLAVVMLAALSLLRSRPQPSIAQQVRRAQASLDLGGLISVGLILAMVTGAALLAGAAMLLLR